MYVRYSRTLRETAIKFLKISYVDISLKFIADSDYAIVRERERKRERRHVGRLFSMKLP